MAVGDDEQLFAGADEPEFPAGQVLDRGRILAEAFGLELQPLVRRPQGGDGRLEILVLAPNPEGGGQSPITHERVGNQDRGQQAEQQPREMPSLPRAILAAAHRRNVGRIGAGKRERRLVGPPPRPGGEMRAAARPGRASCCMRHAVHVSVEDGPEISLRRDGPAGGAGGGVTTTEAVVVLITFPMDADVRGFASTLVGEGCAACVNILPDVESVYRWQGRVERARERQLIVKTQRARVDGLRRRVGELHPYDTPEFVVLPVADGDPRYLAWIAAATAGASTRPDSA